MCMTDPISDMLTRIRNANMIRRDSVDIPASKIKQAILKIMKNEGYIEEYKEIPDNKQGIIRVYLKYGALKQKVINTLVRESKSSRRVYKSANDVGKVCGGFGSAIYSTSKGILCDKECRRLKVGGELICTVS
ncbi:MAG: 30S ribosomal protein S8 [Planctomycetes bacterium RBG_16_41_13]|nr:MAG: 30S ribosomal protein S8 [Planctomycetes bacterium RBG_16_41_13]